MEKTSKMYPQCLTLAQLLPPEKSVHDGHTLYFVPLEPVTGAFGAGFGWLGNFE